MIYLDNSATTYPKPSAVYQAVNNAMRIYGFNPGRGGYSQSIRVSKKIFRTRSVIKNFFNVDSEENVIFTSGCTESLNTVIKGVLRQGDHAVISSFEHNAVFRPIQKLSDNGLITYTVANVEADNNATLENFRKAVTNRTKLFICTHASNVFGIRLPVERLCALAHSYNILFCLDAAQSAGVLPVDVRGDNYDFVCCAGHKYLYGPMGTGLLLINNDTVLDTLTEGGTGSRSAYGEMPSFNPDRFEAGTSNTAGIIGLGAGVDFVSDKGVDSIYKKEARFIDMLRERLETLDDITVYPNNSGAPVLSFDMHGRDSEDIARYLSERSDIAVRSGLHCAPLAHKCMGTIDKGTVRISPSVFTTENDIKILINSLRKLRNSP